MTAPWRAWITLALASALFFLVTGLLLAGLLALCQGGSATMLLVYTAGIGIGSGLTFFASTILLLDYFGCKPDLELFAIISLISTIGSVGPGITGLIADRTDSYVPAFLVLAALVFVISFAVLGMQKPHWAAP